MLKIPTTVLYRELDGEILLVNVDTGYYFGLNEVGTRMWRALERHGRLEPALAELGGVYQIEPERLRADLTELAEKLCEHGLLEEV